MNASVRKRITFTRRGKALRKRQGQNHFNSKERRVVQYRKKRKASFSRGMERSIRQYASHSIT